MKAARSKNRRKLAVLTKREKALRMVYEVARRSGKPFKNPNNIIYRGARHPWYKSRVQNAETGKIVPFVGIGLSREEAKLDLLRQLKRAGWKDRVLGLYRGAGFTKPLYKFQFAPMDAVLPKRLAKKFPGYGAPWHSARKWKKQDRIDEKRRIRARNRRRVKAKLLKKTIEKGEQRGTGEG